MSRNIQNQVARAAFALISPPNRIARRTTARLASGRICSTMDPRAARWCMAGALWKATSELMPSADNIAIYRFVEKLAGKMELGSLADVVEFNDRARAPEIRKAMRKLIEKT